MDEIEFMQNVKIVRARLSQIDQAAIQECMTRLLGMLESLNERMLEIQEQDNEDE